MRALLAFVLLWPFGPKIKKDENGISPWVPGVWEMLFSVGGNNISGEIIDPRGRRCSWKQMIRGVERGFENTIPDCDALAIRGRESMEVAFDPSFNVHTWRPLNGDYRIRVKGSGAARMLRCRSEVATRYNRRLRGTRWR